MLLSWISKMPSTFEVVFVLVKSDGKLYILNGFPFAKADSDSRGIIPAFISTSKYLRRVLYYTVLLNCFLLQDIIYRDELNLKFLSYIEAVVYLLI